MKSSVVPSFFLYGEPPRAVTDRSLHVENLDDRTRPSEWVIRPHAHENLNHIFYIAAGRGTMGAEDRAFAFIAPSLLVVPAKVVHGFHFQPDTGGYVITIADSYLRDLFRRETDLSPLMAHAASIPLAGGAPFEADIGRLAKELAWRAPGHGAAVEGRLLTILVEAFRSIHRTTAKDRDRPMIGPRAILVARFRDIMEARFRDGLGLDVYAEALGVSVARLRGACRAVARSTPSRMLRDRIMLEARRLLIYSNMTVSEVGFSLGFQDPAYFSRFFSKAARETPRGFQQRHRRGDVEAAAARA